MFIVPLGLEVEPWEGFATRIWGLGEACDLLWAACGALSSPLRTYGLILVVLGSLLGGLLGAVWGLGATIFGVQGRPLPLQCSRACFRMDFRSMMAAFEAQNH